MLKLKLTEFVQNPKTALDGQYLCLKNGRVFTANIRLLTNPDYTMPPNCDAGCLYVDDAINKCCLPIDELDEIYEIKS